MSDSPNVVTLAGSAPIHIASVNKTEANLRTELKPCQSGLETDTKKMAYVDDANGYHKHVVEDTTGRIAVGASTALGHVYLNRDTGVNVNDLAIRRAVGSRYTVSHGVPGSYAEDTDNPPVELSGAGFLPFAATWQIIPAFNVSSLPGSRSYLGWHGMLRFNYICQSVDSYREIISSRYNEIRFWVEGVTPDVRVQKIAIDVTRGFGTDYANVDSNGATVDKLNFYVNAPMNSGYTGGIALYNNLYTDNWDTWINYEFFGRAM